MSLLQMSIAGGILILVILVLRALLLHRLPKKTFTALWLVAVARLLVPYSLPVFGQTFQKLEQSVVEGFSDSPVAAVVKPGGVAEAAPNVLNVLWLSGVICCGVYFAVAFLISARKFRGALPVDNEFTCRWLGACRLRRRVAFRQCGGITAPLTYGLFRPVILLPENVDWQDEQRLGYLFAHEFVHIRRLDILKKCFLNVCLCLHWFNPLVWVMFLLFNRDMELACDEAVLRQGGYQSRKDYALLLIDLQERASKTAWSSHFSKTAVEERIVAIMKSKKVAPGYRVASVVMVLTALLCFATSAQGKNDPVIVLEPVQEASWVWPTESRTVSTAFGERIHPVTGQRLFYDHIYIAGERGDPVFSSHGGTVSQVDFDEKYGNFVVVSAADGVQTMYGQLEGVLVREGSQVDASTRIGNLGATGTVTGPCLSYAVLVDGEPVDPMGYFA